MLCKKYSYLFFSATVPVGPPHNYLTLTLRNLGFSTIQSNLLSIPAYVIGSIGLLATCYLSEAIDSRILSTVILQFWALPLLIVLYTFTEQTSQWSYFVVVSLIVGFPYVHPIQVAWTSRNSKSVRTRTVSACMYNVAFQAGYIIAVSGRTFAC
jgi:predicted MFS family arabinose efflux permease